MKSFIVLVLIGAALAQYPHQAGPGAPQGHYQGQHQGYAPQNQGYAPQQQGYAPQQAAPQYNQQPQAYQAPAQAYNPQQRSHNPAAVHYVNIGSQLQGDYKFGYDTGKGNDGQSFREETRLPDGSVQGAYGYVDETGKQRIVRYTAGKDGYKAEGDGIAPPQPAQPAQQQQQHNNQNNYNDYQQY